eukprot:CAMPEP_0113469436 /NCGR_PEP_ID=MMETSP0014_2-20120614/15900_1 /TAXON_ID=2857 /ORGANISM="Nitzschia sp." /LENGTH=317 /DNA_ID=CAMNT_0000361917 /DNA_START=197 /DNA_END=1148 /DNA_ORIENTATION=+ /assembly_acc=CAM_ASM_000159
MAERFESNSVAVDSLVWSCLGLYIHGTSAIALYMDEFPVKLSENEEALWRLFYRSGGLSKKLFKTIVASKFQVEEFLPGQCIPSDDHFNILYKGLAKIEIIDCESGINVNDRTVYSGEMFDCSDLQQFATDGSGFFSKNRIKAKAISKCVVFRISIDNMKLIASHRFAKGVIQTMLIDAMESIIEAYHNGGEKPIPMPVQEMIRDQEQAEQETETGQAQTNVDGNVKSTTTPTTTSIPVPIVQKSEYVAPVFRPLEEWELPQPLDAGSGVAYKRPIQHLWKYCMSYIGWPLPLGGHPVGIRHTVLKAPSRLSHDEKM